MNSVGKTIAVAILMSLFSWQGASASESKAIRVSCTIPAIPGVNAPLVQQEAPRQAEQTAYAQPKERLDPGDGQDADTLGCYRCLILVLISFQE